MNSRVLLTALAVPALVLMMLRAAAAPPKAYKLGDKVANFALNDAAGKTINLSEFKGKVVVINFYGFN